MFYQSCCKGRRDHFSAMYVTSKKIAGRHYILNRKSTFNLYGCLKPLQIHCSLICILRSIPCIYFKNFLCKRPMMHLSIYCYVQGQQVLGFSGNNLQLVLIPVRSQSCSSLSEYLMQNVQVEQDTIPDFCRQTAVMAWSVFLQATVGVSGFVLTLVSVFVWWHSCVMVQANCRNCQVVAII